MDLELQTGQSFSMDQSRQYNGRSLAAAIPVLESPVHRAFPKLVQRMLFLMEIRMLYCKLCGRLGHTWCIEGWSRPLN